MNSNLNKSLLEFLTAATTPFHAVVAMSERLLGAGFQRLREGEQWLIDPGNKYFTTRNDSSILAFVAGTDNPAKKGIRMLGAHTDSPCLRVKPQPELKDNGYWQLGVEVYGGALLNPWFDRDLSLAGRVSYVADEGILRSRLIDFRRPIAVIPSLAIHLDKGVNQNRSINPQTDLPPILAIAGGESEYDFRQLLLAQLHREHPAEKCAEILEYEMHFYDTQAAAIIGLEDEFIASARLDNLLSCFVTIEALISTGTQHSALVVCNDHEEVGSVSAAGAQGPMLKSLLERWLPDAAIRAQALDNSMMISVDNAHGVHPNYADRHDGNHGPMLNGGPVIKMNNNQRYASNSETAAVFRHICAGADVPVQSFVVRSDMGCGSTIGPITAAGLGVRTLDVGVPTFAMHSIRELAGSSDTDNLARALSAYLSTPLQLV
ncbi:MAG: aspartyl aminopeptidase [Halieaceae bacterium]|jgi:aspartyl aminopeptidase